MSNKINVKKLITALKYCSTGTRPCDRCVYYSKCNEHTTFNVPMAEAARILEGVLSCLQFTDFLKGDDSDETTVGIETPEI